MSHPFARLSLHLRSLLASKLVQIPVSDGRVVGTRAISSLRPRLVLDQRSLDRSSNGKHQLLVSRSQTALVMQHRFKKGKAGEKSGKEEAAESDDEDSDSEEEVNPDDFLDVEFECVSNRLDIAARGGLNITRESAVEKVAAGLIRLNGLKAVKTDPVSDLDVIDSIRGRNPEDPSKLDIVRLEIISVPDIASSKGRMKMKGRRWRKLTIDNYKEEPFESLVTNVADDEPRF